MTYKGWYAIKPNQSINQSIQLFFTDEDCRIVQPRPNDRVVVFNP